MGFSKQVRVEMFVRDNATCQDCGRKWDDGWMLQAAHYDHSRNRNYDCVENGRMLCIDCHIRDHQRAFEKARDRKDKNLHASAIRMLKCASRYNYKAKNRQLG